MFSLIWNWPSTRRPVWEATNGLYSDTYNVYDSLAAFEKVVQA